MLPIDRTNDPIFLPIGSEAGAIYYRENKPKETTLIHWEDQDNDQVPEIEEIEVIS